MKQKQPNAADCIVGEAREEIDAMLRGFFDQLCSIAPGSDPQLVDFTALERAQDLAARGRRHVRAAAIADFGAELVLATPGLAEQRKRPN